MPPFQYDNYRNPYAGSIAELMLQKGLVPAQTAERIAQAQAGAALNSGQAWGNAFQQAGAIGMAIPRMVQNQQAEAQDAQLRQAKLDQINQERADNAAVDKALSVSGNWNERIAAAPGHLQPHIMQMAREAQRIAAEDTKSIQDARQRQADFSGRLALAIQAVDYNGPAALTAMQAMEDMFGDDPDRVAQIRQMRQRITQFPDQIKPLTDATIAGIFPDKVKKPTEQGFTLGPGQRRFDASGQQVAEVPETPKPAPTGFTLSPGQQRFDASGQPIASVPDRPDTKPTDDAPLALTDDALNVTAQHYAMTGQLPPMGMGKQGAAVRTKIINRAAELYANLNLPEQQAAYQANKATLSKLEQQRAAIGAFEQTAQKNIDIFLEQAGKVVDTGSPLANRLMREVSGSVLGSKDQAGYDAARLVAVNEIAKITSNPNLSGTLSDSARHEVEAFNPREATLAQSVRVMRLLKRDMENRTGSLDEQIADVKRRIATPPTRRTGTGAGPTPGGNERDPLGIF